MDSRFHLRAVQSTDDVERLIGFNQDIHRHEGELDLSIGAWTRDLLNGRHPTVVFEDYVLVEDTSTGDIVSAMVNIPQEWTFAGVPFGVGRVEIVGTHTGYRNQGLVRELFAAFHARCRELNLPVQSITGIPYFYRQFGYEYALDLGGGKRLLFDAIKPAPSPSPYTLREWQPADLPRLQQLYSGFVQDRLVTCARPDNHWHYRYRDMDPGNVNANWLFVIERETEIVGYVPTASRLWGKSWGMREIVLDAPYPEILPWLIARLRDEAGERFSASGELPNSFYFNFGVQHPALRYLAQMGAVDSPPYAWYIRVEDIAAFILHIRAALEERISRSSLAGLTQILTLDFYRSGLRLEFDDGHLVDAQNLPFGIEDRDAACPPGAFLQLLFGRRTINELRYILPDAWANPEALPILDELFPRQASWVEPLS